MAFTFGFGGTDSSGTGRSGTGFDVSRFNEFLNAIHGTLGGPFTIGDLFQLAPRSQALFSGEPTDAARPGGGFNLGFGRPPSFGGGPTGLDAGAPSGPGPTDVNPNPPAGGTTPPPATGGTPPPSGAPARLFTEADVLPAWNDDPEKRMDLPRLLRQANLDPGGFSLEDFQNAVARAGKYGFSGRSQGNFGKALGLLQNLGTTTGAFGGGKGTGVF